jgi:hypothetical protein
MQELLISGLLVASFSGFWEFRAPIAFIGDFFFHLIVIQATNELLRRPFAPPPGTSRVLISN